MSLKSNRSDDLPEDAPGAFPDWWDEFQLGRMDADRLQELRQKLAHRPADLERLADEISLERLLRQSHPPRPSTNFTARVLQEIARNPDRAPRNGRLPGVAWFSRFPWFPSTASAIFAMICVLGWLQFERQQRQRIARNVAEVAHAAEASRSAGSLPMDVFANFDAVRGLGLAPRADDVALLSVLSQP